MFEARPWTILNFAVIGNETRYHSAGDDLAALDRRSLQHMGEQALAVDRRAAAGEAPAAEGERLYTDLVGRSWSTLPMLFGLVLLGLLLAFLPDRRLAAPRARPAAARHGRRRWPARRAFAWPAISSSA